MPEDEGYRYRGTALDSCILVLEALEQEMPQSDVTEHEESAPHMLAVISPAPCSAKDAVKAVSSKVTVTIWALPSFCSRWRTSAVILNLGCLKASTPAASSCPGVSQPALANNEVMNSSADAGLRSLPSLFVRILIGLLTPLGRAEAEGLGVFRDGSLGLVLGSVGEVGADFDAHFDFGVRVCG